MAGHAICEGFGRILMKEHMQNGGFFPERALDPQHVHADQTVCQKIGKSLMQVRCNLDLLGRQLDATGTELKAYNRFDIARIAFCQRRVGKENGLRVTWVDR
jgi:hypothetical protein